MFDLPSASRNDERSNGVLAKSEGLCQTEMLYYDENMAIEVAKEEAWEDGLEEGIEKGIKKGVKKGVKKGESNLIERMLKKGKSPESIAFDTDIPVEQIIKISERLKSVV